MDTTNVPPRPYGRTRINYDRLKLLTPESKPKAQDRLILSVGPVRTPKKKLRVSPYRSPSPDPAFRTVNSRVTSSGTTYPPSSPHVVEHDPHPRRSNGVTGSSGIAKPPGQVGKDYQLRSELEWPDKRFDEIKSFIQKAPNQKLDSTRTLAKQNQSSVQAVREMVLSKYPFLGEYCDYWGINDFMECCDSHSNKNRPRHKGPGRREDA
ncbi:hypothetical protein F5876DRAFT_71064 [Lentinula aff. lateritia]|uniref:Uncharacterized protein n=1 Tax=Lentinula aff. lateritia TaxID=2804960 RepID=A0ACC1TGS6_9AGAR|nr:hypothetical protein F5876DRAFT_71064 [Lentinula aff. lateritia]